MAPRPELPARGRRTFEGLRETRELLADVRAGIARVKETGRRERLEQEARLAEEPIVEATHAAHSC